MLHHGTREDASPGLHVALPALQVCLPRLPQHAGAHGHEGVIGCQEALLLEAWLRGLWRWHVICRLVTGVPLHVPRQLSMLAKLSAYWLLGRLSNEKSCGGMDLAAVQGIWVRHGVLGIWIICWLAV